MVLVEYHIAFKLLIYPTLPRRYLYQHARAGGTYLILLLFYAKMYAVIDFRERYIGLETMTSESRLPTLFHAAHSITDVDTRLCCGLPIYTILYRPLFAVHMCSHKYTYKRA